MLTRLQTAFWFGLLLMLLTGCPNGGSSNKPAVGVVIPPESASVASGGEFTVTVEADHVGRSFYAAFDVVYDPLIIRFVKADEGGFLSRDGADETFFDAALGDGQPGRLAVGITRVAPSGAVSGSGTLVSLTFQAIASGDSDIALSDPKGLRNSEGGEVTVKSWKDAAVTVN
jgi:general secretion pathway protein D